MTWSSRSTFSGAISRSASRNATTPPLASAKPRKSAAPLPRFASRRTTRTGNPAAATRVASEEVASWLPSSTTITSASRERVADAQQVRVDVVALVPRRQDHREPDRSPSGRERRWGLGAHRSRAAVATGSRGARAARVREVDAARRPGSAGGPAPRRARGPGTRRRSRGRAAARRTAAGSARRARDARRVRRGPSPARRARRALPAIASATRPTPATTAARRGVRLNETTPWAAKSSIFAKEYFERPARRRAGWKGTATLRKPTQLKRPRRKTERSWICRWKTSATRREIRRKSAAPWWMGVSESAFSSR